MIKKLTEELKKAHKTIYNLNEELVQMNQVLDELRSRFGEDIIVAIDEIYEDIAEDY